MPEVDMALAVLAEKLGVAGPYLWQRLVEYTSWSNLTRLLYGPILALAWYVVYQWYRHIESDDFCGDGDLHVGPMVCISVMIAIAITAFAICLPNIITAIVKPEAVSVRAVIDAL